MFSNRTTLATRRSRHARRRSRQRLAVETMEARCLLSGLVESYADLMSEQLMSPINGPVHLGSASGQSGPVGHGSAPGTNVNTDTTDTASNETSIAVNPHDPRNLIGGANDYQLAVDSQGNVTKTVLSRAHVSLDGGQTWTDYVVPEASQYVATGDPSVAFDATGRAYYATLGLSRTAPGDVLVSTSTDKGQTWSMPSTVALGSASSSQILFNDKEYIAAWGDGNAIVTWDLYTYDGQGNFQSVVVVDSVTHDGVPNQLVLVPGALHGFGLSNGGPDLMNNVVNFLQTYD